MSTGYFTVPTNDESVWPIWNVTKSGDSGAANIQGIQYDDPPRQPTVIDTQGNQVGGQPAQQQEVDIVMNDADGDGISDDEEDVEANPAGGQTDDVGGADAGGGEGSDMEPGIEPDAPEAEPMDTSSQRIEHRIQTMKIAKIAQMKRDLHELKMARHFANSGARPPSQSATPMLASVSRVDSAPRMNDLLTFRNSHGEELYKKARSQLQPYARVQFADAFKSGAVSPRDLVIASFNLAACMRAGLPFQNKIFNFHPDKQTVRARSVTIAASQLGQAFQHIVLPAQLPFLSSGPDINKDIAPAVTSDDGTKELGGVDPTPPVDGTTQDEIIDPKNDVEPGVIRGLVDKDQFGQDNIPSLRNIRGEQAVLWELQAKAAIRWGVGFYRGSSSMQRDATTLLDKVAKDTVALLKRAKLFEDASKISEPKALEVLIDRNRLSWDQARALMSGRRAIIAENVAPLYSDARRTQDIEASSGYFNKDNDRNKADKIDSEEIIKLLAALLGSDEVARFWWTQYSKAEIVMWKILAAEGESAKFEMAMRQFIYLAYQIGFMIDGRTRIFLQAHCDTYDEVLYDYDGDLEPDECCPPKPKCKPKCITRYVYCEPTPCVEIVQPPCVDVVCVPHCVEPVCPPKPVCPPPCPDPCDMWHEILVPEPENCGPPCQNQPYECMKKACATLYGLNGAKFMLKAECDTCAKPKSNKWLEQICRQIECFVEVQQLPRTADKRVAEAAAMSAAIIKRLDNGGTLDQLHMYATALKQMMWILFKTLWCSGSCHARLLMIEVASYMYTLSKRPTAAGSEIAASKENLPIVGAFVAYLKEGPRAGEMSQKFQLVEQDAPFMLPDTVRNPEALFHTLRGMLDAIQDWTVYHKTSDFDMVEVNFIYGEWDYVYKRMVDKLGADFQPETKIFTGEEKSSEPKPAPAPTPAPTPAPAPAPAVSVPTTITTTTTTTTAPTTSTSTTATTSVTPALPPPLQPSTAVTTSTTTTTPTTLPPPPLTVPVTVVSTAAATSTTAVTGTTPMIKTQQRDSKTKKLSTKGKPSNDDDDEASDEFENKSASAAAKELSVEELLKQYA